MMNITYDTDQYGLLVVFISVLLAEAGLPLPVFPILVTAGAFLTKNFYQATELVSAGVGGGLTADLVLYWSGKRYGALVLALLCKTSISPEICVRQTETLFLKVGKWSLLFAKFLPALSTISVAMAGTTGMPLTTFLLLNGIGVFLFVFAGVLLGAIFRDAIMEVLGAIAAVGKLSILPVVLAVCLYLFARWWRRRAFIRRLHTDRVTVADLPPSTGEGHEASHC